ncbi:hypothetical protein L1049_010008 [Liquidambar formosana]|uniref:Piwi domain-containing protein n=1 Tax=Liquidambar formosana TaxID=63359 RepID=A0AAP0N6V4_LIQFO
MLATTRAASRSSSVSMGSFNVPIQVEEILVGAKIKLTYRGYPKISTIKGISIQKASQLKKVKNSGESCVNPEFGIQFADKPTLVEAQVLPPPRLKYRDTAGQVINVDPRQGYWETVDKIWYLSVLLKECPLWNLKEMGGQGEQLQLLIVVLPDSSGSYGIIKRVCETKLGIISQCCMPTKVHNQPKQYLENLALKINVKVGGQNTVLFDNFPLISDHPTIIFGADVTHPNNRDGSSFSIAARGVYSEQSGGKEIIEDLYKLIQDPLTGEISPGGMVRELLLVFLKINKFKPERIIFYRDGGSQHQFLQVLTHEVTAIQKACSSIQEGYQPPITFVVGVKRHHMCFFPENEEGNISAGTIIDTQSCHPTGYDFYLNSHPVIEEKSSIQVSKPQIGDDSGARSEDVRYGRAGGAGIKGGCHRFLILLDGRF